MQVPFDQNVWDESKIQMLHTKLNDNKHKFDTIVDNLISNTLDVDVSMENFSKLLYDISFDLYGKTVYCTDNWKKKLKSKKITLV